MTFSPPCWAMYTSAPCRTGCAKLLAAIVLAYCNAADDRTALLGIIKRPAGCRRLSINEQQKMHGNVVCIIKFFLKALFIDKDFLSNLFCLLRQAGIVLECI